MTITFNPDREFRLNVRGQPINRKAYLLNTNIVYRLPDDEGGKDVYLPILRNGQPVRS